MPTIHNVRLDKHFTVTSNLVPEDPNLSWAAKGLLWYLLSRPADWSVHTHQLANIFGGSTRGCGKEAVLSMIKELKENGYILYTKTRSASGHWNHRYDVYPMPQKDFKKMFPERVKPALDGAALVKDDVILSTDLNKNLLKQELIIATTDLPKVVQEKRSSLPAGGNKKLYSCLDQCSDLTATQKLQLLKYEESTVSKAVKYCYRPNAKLEGEQARIKQLIAFCKNPDDYTETLKTLDSPTKGLPLKERILGAFKKDVMYNNRYEFDHNDEGAIFLDTKANFTYFFEWKGSNRDQAWWELLKKLGIVK